MQPSHIKLLLLVLAMLGGIGGYYFVTTSPASEVKKTEKVELQANKPAAVNVSNVHIEQTAAGVTVSGQAKDVVDPGFTFFQLNATGTVPRPYLDKIAADILIENGKLRSGTVEATLKAGEKTDAVIFAIARVNTIGNGGTMFGSIQMRGITKEVSVPFTRDGNAIAGETHLDMAALGFADPDFKKDIRLNWRLGIK